ncbi:MAG: hypothetical protein P1V97_23390 [Planctomycetota bacterium]|nr:hypothetical protein [Planctomycetota bacterium]
MSHVDSALLVLAKLALADGKIDVSEESFLTVMMDESENFHNIDELIREANSKTLAEMIERLEKYEDKFFVALRAYLMANVDLHYDATEEAMFNRLIGLLGITEDDRELIRATEASIKDEEPQPPSERIQALYQASSFFKAEA